VRVGCAWFLVVLIATPFTAPFSSCDLRVLFAESRASEIHLDRAPATHAFFEQNLDDTSPGPLLEEESFKDVLVSTPTTFALSFIGLPDAPRQARVMSTFRNPLVSLRL
jgi:hypothetical protein